MHDYQWKLITHVTCWCIFNYMKYLTFRSGSTEICSGRGECVCGNCQCKSRRGDLPLIYTGRWCECDDSRCPSFNGAVCGGKMLKNTKNKSFVYLNYLSVFATKDGTRAIEGK